MISAPDVSQRLTSICRPLLLVYLLGVGGGGGGGGVVVQTCSIIHLLHGTSVNGSVSSYPVLQDTSFSVLLFSLRGWGGRGERQFLFVDVDLGVALPPPSGIGPCLLLLLGFFWGLAAAGNRPTLAPPLPKRMCNKNDQLEQWWANYGLWATCGPMNY